MRTRSILQILLILIAATGINAEFETDALGEDLGPRTNKYLSGSTSEARAQMAAFTDENLQKISNAFKKSHTASDQRLFWLSEELYRRNAERVAAERIRYLYYAVLSAFFILTGFAFLTWRKNSSFVPTPNPQAGATAGALLTETAKRKRASIVKTTQKSRTTKRSSGLAIRGPSRHGDLVSQRKR